MKMQQVTIFVSNAEKSVEFYREITKLEIQVDMRAHGGPVFLGDDMEATKIELIERPGATYEPTAISVGFAAEDVHAEYERLKELGYNPTDMVSPAPGVNFFFVKDPDGLDIQIT